MTYVGTEKIYNRTNNSRVYAETKIIPVTVQISLRKHYKMMKHNI